MKTKKKSETERYIETFNKYSGHPVKIILKLFKGEHFTVLKSSFFSILQNLPVWVIPIATSNIINVATYPDKHSLTELWINAIVIAVCVLQNIFSTYSVSVYFDGLLRKIEYNLRSCLIEKLQQLSIMFHKNTSSGKLQSKIMRDCENIIVMLSSMYRQLFMVVITIIIAIAVTMRKCPVVMLFFLFVVPAEMIMLKLLSSRIQRRNTGYRREMENAQSKVSEMIELIPVTRAHGLQDREISKMENKFGGIRRAGYSLDKTSYFFGACSWVLMQLSNLACIAFSGYLAYTGKISVGECVLYQSYFGQIVGGINSLLTLYPTITKGTESVNSIGEILREEKVETNNSILPLRELTGQVDFQGIRYKYEDSPKWVLNDFNLSVKAGESVAFVGGSGTGKSTILNLLIGYDTPQEGRILVDRINISNLDINEFRSQIAVVPQNTVLFSGTVRDNITYGIDGVTDEDLWKVLQDVGLDDIVGNMENGLNTYLGEHGGNLSGGQRQRISIARALLRKPKIIIFDEATSALDSVSEKKVQNAVDKMMKQCTTFLVAHRLSTVKNADRIAVIENGRIAEIGSYDELMEKKGLFYGLKKLQE